MAQVLSWEIQALGQQYGIERLGFLTLTFPDHVTDIREAQRRFHNLQRRVITARYKRAIAVWERFKSGRIHFHLVVVVEADIRTGVDFEAIEREDYRTAGKALRAEWAFWRKMAKRYRFGRTELLPVKSNIEALRRYVGKYISKHVKAREREDLGARVVRFIGYKPADRRYRAQFGWNTPNGKLWRLKVRAFAQSVHCDDLAQLKELFGPRWCYALLPSILSQQVELPVCDSEDQAIRMADRELVRRYQPLVALWNYQRARETKPARVYNLKC